MSGFEPGIFDEAAMSEGANRFKQWLGEKTDKVLQATNPATATSFDPLVAANKVAQAPVKMGEAAGKVGAIGGEGIVQALHPDESPEETRQKHPIQIGVASGAGEFAGELVGNPTNWPFLMEGAIARPLLKRAVGTAFAGQMVKSTAEGAQQLAQQWDSIDSHERAKQVTKLGLGGAFAEEGARHAVHANVAAAHGLDITPNLHPGTAPKMVKGTRQNGGSTIDPWTGKDHFGTNKTTVSFTSGLKVEIPVDQFKDQGESLIHAYANQPQIARILREPNTVLGTSMNPATGNVELEPTYLSKSENAAKKYGSPQFWNQREVYHLGRAEAIPTEGTGAPEQTPPVDPVERVRLMNSEQPQPTRGVYRHHSDILIKPDENGISTLTGTTRFASRIGQERGRSGEPGVYAYDMNTPAEAGVRERQHEYRMIKDAAIADANDPKYAEIAQTQGGHAVEKAIKADGYDGYTNSQVPGSYFFFGDSDARHVSKGPPPTPEEIAAQRGSFTVDPSKRLGAGQLGAARPAQEIQPSEDLSPMDQARNPEAVAMIQQKMDANLTAGKNAYADLSDDEKGTMSWHNTYTMERVRNAVAKGGGEFAGGPNKNGLWQVRDPKTNMLVSVDNDITPQKVREAIQGIRSGVQIQSPDGKWSTYDSKGVDTTVRPQDYLSRVGADEGSILKTPEDAATVEHFKQQIASGQPVDAPEIHLDEDGNIIGADGRHRALAYQQSGVERMPAVVKRQPVAGRPPVVDNEPKVNSAPVDRQPIERPETIPGAKVSRPTTTYSEATSTGTNPWVRSSADGVSHNSPSNAGRQLLVQFASDLLMAHSGTADAASAYYDKLYSGTREGYARLNDFWEIPQWIGYASHFLPDADVYVVRDMNQAVNFLNEAKYDHVAFSALDVNKNFIRELARGYQGAMDVGGYVDKSTFADLPHVKWHDNMASLAADAGVPYHEGVDYRHFAGSDVIPRLTMSSGCLHKCAFCTIEKTLRIPEASVINQASDAIAGLGSKLVYVNDKTFGQAKNYAMLSDLATSMKAKNPNFQGFVVQTTAAQMNKFTPEFLAKSGIKFVELGIESYNDPILKAMHKPATENLINKAVDKLRENKIALIPNIMVGLPGETAETYQKTLNFLMDNKDIISHANIYNVAVYENTELAKKLTTASPDDFNENVTEKSFHDDPALVQKFAGDAYGIANKMLDRSPEALAPAKPMTEVMKALNLDPTDLLRPEEKARIGPRAILQLKKEYAALPPMEEAVAATQAGMSGADWWRRGRELYPTLSSVDDHYFPSDPAEQRKFANVMGATSPHQAVETAELEALHVWNQYRSKIVDAGKPVTEANIRKYVKMMSLPDTKTKAVVAALQGQDVFEVGRKDRGLKRSSMGQALGGGPEGSEPGEAYVGDTHMADLKGIEPATRSFNSSAVYYAMAAQDRTVARQLNMHLSDVQAAQWATKMAIQNVMGEIPDAPAETILGRIDAGTINEYKKDLIDLMRTDPQIQRYMVEEYGFDPAKLEKLNTKLAGIPSETLGQSVPARNLAPQLKASVERLRPKYGKLVAPQGPLDFGPEGDTSFNFGSNAPEVPELISAAASSAKAKR